MDDWRAYLRAITLVDKIEGLAAAYDEVIGPLDDPRKAVVLWAHTLMQGGLPELMAPVCWMAVLLGSSPVFNDLGNMLLALDRDREAEECFRRAIALDPENVFPHCGLGALLHRLGKHRASEASFLAALEIKPLFAGALHGLGNAQRGQKRLEEAERSYRAALAQRPDWSQAHNALGDLLRELERFDEAAQCYRKAIELDPQLPEPHHGLMALPEHAEA